MNFRAGIVYFWNFRPGILNSRPDYVFFSNFQWGILKSRGFIGLSMGFTFLGSTKAVLNPYFSHKTNILEIERRKKKVFENSKLTRRPIINPY